MTTELPITTTKPHTETIAKLLTKTPTKTVNKANQH